jgi:hypothetical protein
VLASHSGFQLDDDPRRVDRDAVWRYLSSQAYRARWRRREHVEQQIDGARDAHGLYARVGFAAPDDSYCERPGVHPPTLP